LARLVALLCLLATAPAAAQDCRLALALGFDVSASVDDREYALILQGTAAGLRDPEVAQAVFAGAPVALAAFVWAGRREQAVIAHWRLMESPSDLARFADVVERFPRPTGDPLGVWGGRTGVGAAMSAGGRLLELAPPCDRQTLDLAGDGESNDGPVSVHLPGVTVNALAVGGDLAFDHWGDNHAPLSAWYAENVIQGFGAFVLVAEDYTDFARAIRLKLLRELRPPLLGALR
jgi:hypothetical protein